MPAHQPCDACGFNSKATFLLKSGNILTLCGHHSQQHAKAIEEYLAEVFYDPVEVGGTGSSKGAP